MIYTYNIENLPLQTGDILCTTSQGEEIQPGQFWRLLGRMVPGVVDHVAIYLGPGGHCVESALNGVVAFDVPSRRWIAPQMVSQRGNLIDELYGVAYPLAGRSLSKEAEDHIREGVAAYCLSQAEANMPYNLNFFNPDVEDGFYCSQLIYKAYIQHGINLNTGLGVPNVPGTTSIIFPQEIWSGCEHRRRGEK